MLIKPIIRRFQKLQSWYPLTVFGTLLYSTAVFLLGRGLLLVDDLAALTGGVVFLFCLALSIIVILQPVSRIRDRVYWNSGYPLVAGRYNDLHTASVGSLRLIPFLRIHIHVVARLKSTSRTLHYFWHDYSVDGFQRITMNPPVPGRLEMSGEFYLSDIFGITRRSIIVLEGRLSHVLPPAEGMEKSDMHLSIWSEDNVQSRKTQAYEKIFIRDYQDGDLVRDINWKASGRINKLLTRIPPVSQSLTMVVQIVLLADSRVLELSYMKSLLRGFIETLFHTNEGLILELWLHEERYELKSMEDVDAILKILAEWQPSLPLQPDLLPTEDAYIILFSHEDCKVLSEIIKRYEQCRLVLVRNCHTDSYDRRICHFTGEGFFPIYLFSEIQWRPSAEDRASELLHRDLIAKLVELREFRLKKELL